MSSSRATFGALFLAALPVAAQAQLNVQWVGFQNDTTARLVTTDPLVGANDVQEKDFAEADVDHDGDIDFIVVRKVPLTFPGGKRGVLFMNEDGVLVDRTADYAMDSDIPGTSQGLLDEANNRDVVFADFNNDGWVDFATAVTISDVPTVLPKYLSHPRIYINKGADGSGNWLGFKFMSAFSPNLYVLDGAGNPNMTIGPYPGRFCGVAAGDVDGDGDIDLYFADYDSGEVGPGEPAGRDLNDRLWINDGTGHFTDSYQTRMTSQMLLSAFGINAEIKDMNGDGKNDIVKDSALGAPQSVSISYRTPASGQAYTLYDQPYGAAPYFVSVGDLNNDNKLDMVITDDTADRYLLNNGNDGVGRATFVPHPFTFADGGGESDFGSQSTVADLDGDGWKDVIIADNDVDTDSCPPFRRSFIYHNLGNAPNVTLREEAQQTGSGGWKGAVGITGNDLMGVYHSAVFDIDGDGDQDLILGRCSSNVVWMNTRNPCPAVKFGTVSPNSTGQPARVATYGSGALTQNLPPGYPTPHSALIFNMTNLPAKTSGHLIWSRARKNTCSPSGHGQLCLQNRTARPFPVLDDVAADASGHARFVFDFADAPLADAQPGDHIYFQFVYNDAGAPGGGFNLSEAMDVKVCQ